VGIGSFFLPEKTAVGAAALGRHGDGREDRSDLDSEAVGTALGEGTVEERRGTAPTRAALAEDTLGTTTVTIPRGSAAADAQAGSELPFWETPANPDPWDITSNIPRLYDPSETQALMGRGC
jgi:hypothetical protein